MDCSSHFGYLTSIGTFAQALTPLWGLERLYAFSFVFKTQTRERDLRFLMWHSLSISEAAWKTVWALYLSLKGINQYLLTAATNKRCSCLMEICSLALVDRVTCKLLLFVIVVSQSCNKKGKFMILESFLVFLSSKRFGDWHLNEIISHTET